MEQVIIKPNGKYTEQYGDTTVDGDGYIMVSASDDRNTGKVGTIASGITNGISSAASGSSPNGIVAVRDYAAGKGYSGIVNWDGDSVTVGGTKIKPEYVKDGTAYVKRSDADGAIANMEKSAGIIGNNGALEATESKYGKAIDSALKAVLNRDTFSYNPEDDVVYAAYKAQYEREAKDAFRRVLNDNNTSVTGASGAVLSEAIASRNDYLTRLTDMIPELADTAYKRYADETDRLTGNLKLLSGLADSYYDKLYTANRQSYQDVINAGAAERDERQRWIDNERADEKAAREYAQLEIENERNRINDSYKNALSALAIEKGGIELQYYPDMLEADLLGARLDNGETAMSNALSRGFFVAADEAALPWLSSYRTGYGYSINPQLAMAAYEYQKEYSKKRADIDAAMGW